MSLVDTLHQRLALLTALIGAIAAAKLWAATLTGSSAMFAEAVRSIADLCSLALASVALARTATRPSPGEIAFWSAAVGILMFSFASGIAIYEGVDRLAHPRPLTEPGLAYVVLIAGTVLQAAQIALHSTFRSAQPEPLGNCERIRSGIGLLSGIAALAGLAAADLGEVPAADGHGAIAVGLHLAVVAAMMALETRTALAATEPSRPATATIVTIPPILPAGTSSSRPSVAQTTETALPKASDGNGTPSPRKHKGKRRRR